MQELIDGLRNDSTEFSQWWREHDVRDNLPTRVVLEESEKGRVVLERVVIRPSENARMKILVFTPIAE